MFNNNKDFYPTPDTLIFKMLNDIDFNRIATILEPSAGKGNIVDILEQKKKYYKQLDIDCIENDENLQSILKGKEYKLIHNDFLTFNSMKKYDLIIMNPPFSNGDKHILKAIELQEQYGGCVICLLNAETLNNPFSNTRKDLKRKLEEYDAQVEYIENAFYDAERKTNVEIVLIKIILPTVERESYIYTDNLRKMEEQEEFQEQEQHFLAENDFLKSIVQQYNLEVKLGIDLIKEYKAMSKYILEEITAEGQKGKPLLNLDLDINKNRYSSNLSINGYIKEVRRKYWKALFNNKNFIGQLTNNLRQDYYNRIEQLIDYDFSIYNIYEIKIEMTQNIVKGVEETIIHLFEELSNKHSWYDEMSKNIHYYNGWKTNKAYIINKKVIIPLDSYDWGSYRPSNYKVVNKLEDIEKCLNYLDGGLTEQINIQEALKFAEDYGETKKIQLKYFTVTFYKKGTCHIEFTSLDLLKKFNIFGSQKKNWLPPSYGKAEYKNMTAEEKQVINEFEGEQEYKKTMLNKQYYLFNANSVLMLEENIA